MGTHLTSGLFLALVDEHGLPLLSSFSSDCFACVLFLVLCFLLICRCLPSLAFFDETFEIEETVMLEMHAGDSCCRERERDGEGEKAAAACISARIYFDRSILFCYRI